MKLILVSFLAIAGSFAGAADAVVSISGDIGVSIAAGSESYGYSPSPRDPMYGIGFMYGRDLMFDESYHRIKGHFWGLKDVTISGGLVVEHYTSNLRSLDEEDYFDETIYGYSTFDLAVLLLRANYLAAGAATKRRLIVYSALGPGYLSSKFTSTHHLSTSSDREGDVVGFSAIGVEMDGYLRIPASLYLDARVVYGGPETAAMQFATGLRWTLRPSKKD